MLTVLTIMMVVLIAMIVAARIYTRRPMNDYDRWCAQVDADLDARATPSVPVVAERRAA